MWNFSANVGKTKWCFLPFRSESSGLALEHSEGRGFDPCQMLDGSGVKAMQGPIPVPNSGS